MGSEWTSHTVWCKGLLVRAGLCFGLLAVSLADVHAADTQAEHSLLREIYQELIEIDTTHSTGDTTRAARAMAQRLLDAGFVSSDLQVLEPFPRKGNLVLRYKGSGDKKPMLLLSHLDVAEVRRAEWTGDPFKLREVDGYFIARGSIDDKARGAILVSVLAQLKREGFAPKRDIILALTADEERGEVPSNGVLWLLRHQRPLIDAEFGINEGGETGVRQGKPFALNVQFAEKTDLVYELQARGPSGHSSRPTRANAIVELAEAVTRIGTHEFPMNLSDVTRDYFARAAAFSPEPLASAMRGVARAAPDPAAAARLSTVPNYNALLRTTCAVTMIEGGSGESALPEHAKATINCRVLPNDEVAGVESTLASLAGSKVSLKRVSPLSPSPSSPMRPDLIAAIEKISGQMWPDVSVVPVLSPFATDGQFLRNAGIPVYGVSGLFLDSAGYGAHASDERMMVRWLFESREFMYRLVKALAG